MKVVFSFIFLCLLIGQTSCRSLIDDLVLSIFSVNGKAYYRFIVDRVPRYGLGNPDGCVVETQIALSLVQGKGDSLVGEIKDSKTLTALTNASVQLKFIGQVNPVRIHADSFGRIQIQSPSTIRHIEVSYIGYRNLSVDLKGKKGVL